MSGQIDCAGLSHLPPQLDSNPDEFFVADLNRSLRVHQTSLDFDQQTRLFGNSIGKILIVADGVGSDGSADRASTLAVDAVSSYILNSQRWMGQAAHPDTDLFRQQLHDALAECQDSIHHEGDVLDIHEGMGANITIAYVVWPRLFLIQVGENRCYLMRDSQLTELTSEPAQSSRTGEEAGANVVGGATNALQPQTHVETLRLGDRLLIASNGLHKFVSDLVIAEALQAEDSSDRMLNRLARHAVGNGVDDAVTAVITQFSDGESEGLDEPPMLAHSTATASHRIVRKKQQPPNRTNDQRDPDAARSGEAVAT
jgi:protein phosphatase